MAPKTLLFIFHAHVPYVRNQIAAGSIEESRFFETLSYSFLPFLRMCRRLETDGIPFKCALVISPLLCEMFNDPLLQEQYIALLDKHIAFGQEELFRAAEEQKKLVEMHLAFFERTREDFVTTYKKNILKQIGALAAKGCIELIATSATPCFFPLYQNMPEALTAQIEIGLISFRECFTIAPEGFWLPAMGYHTGIDRLIKSAGIDYTILESQSFLFAEHFPAQGIFSPAASESGLGIFGKDYMACAEIMQEQTGFYQAGCYLNTDKDAGFELEEERLFSLFPVQKGRRATGFCYYNRHPGHFYNRTEAEKQLLHDASLFLNNRNTALSAIRGDYPDRCVCSTCVLPFDFLGKVWFEGMHWLEAVFRCLAQTQDMNCALPSEYLKSVHQIQTIDPFYASALPSGYADELVNSTNDWMYPQIQKATERMIDLARRFPDDPGLKERILNMAAKEVLLAQSIDWPLLTNAGINADYAVKQCMDHIEAFTAVYEALGSGTAGTDLLIKREKKYPVFSEMNYRFFK